MSTQIQITPASGITIGTTPIKSGTDGRVLFQNGGVVQQDAGFLFSSTDKSLTNYGKGAVTSNTSFGALVFQAGTGLGTANTAVGWAAANFLTTGSNNTMIGYRAGGGVLGSNFTGNNNTLIGSGAGLYLSSGIQNTFVGNSTGTSITTGSYNTILGHFTGSLPATTTQNVILSDGTGAVALWKNSSGFNGFGYNPLTDTLGAKLDVRAQGALSTDVALRIQNSGNSHALQQFNGDGSWLHRNNANTFYEYFNGTNLIEYRYTGGFTIGTNNDVTSFNLTCNTGALYLRGGSNILNIVADGNYHFEENSGTLATTGAGAIVLKNRTAPSASVVDRIFMFSKDIVAGNAAFHTKSENGDEQRIYSIGGWGTPSGTLTRTTFDESTVTLPELAQRVAALITDLKTGHQLLKA